MERRHLNLNVVRLPEYITPEYVKTLDSHPGILSLALRQTQDPVTGEIKIQGSPFVVPGGRFNEMYGWDSYFEALGLIIDGRISLAQGMVDNFVYQIEHYGKILNANRSYYLSRSQPPFLSDMIIQVYKALKQQSFSSFAADNTNTTLASSSSAEDAKLSFSATSKSRRQRKHYTPPELKVWLARGIRAAIKDLLSIWLAPPRLDPFTGLSKYVPEGLGVPPETEAGHFYHVFEGYARRLGVSVDVFEAMYNSGEVLEPELDEYFLHDRAGACNFFFLKNIVPQLLIISFFFFFFLILISTRKWS